MPPWLTKGIYLLVPVAAVALLALHTAKVGGIAVDTTTLGLLTLLLLSPLAPYVRRLSAGGLEAEIGPQDAQQLQAAAAELPVPPEDRSAIEATAPTIAELIARDPPLGLAKLRIELEAAIRSLYQRRAPSIRRAPGLRAMVRELSQHQVLPPEIAAPLDDVIALANRAVHGEYVPPDVAAEIADVGMRLLAALRDLEDIAD
jgi:hypothetical protein